MIRVAIVEDEEVLRETMTHALRDRGFDVESWSGIPPRKQRRFDVVVLDLRLRDSEGDETLRQARKRFGPTPIIVWTGETSVHHHAQAIHEGAEWVVTKGQPTNVLADAIVQVHTRATRLFDITGLRAARDELTAMMSMPCVGG